MTTITALLTPTTPSVPEDAQSLDGTARPAAVRGGELQPEHKSAEVASVQEGVLLMLAFGIGAAKERGEVVPCDQDPASWDATARPADCDGCPVLGLCRVYLHTGAVTYPTVLAGRRILNGGGSSDSARGRRGIAA